MIIVICGPTGVGKTKLSIELAKKLHGEIINADSMQTYKDLNIATAKIKEEEKENIPHHLFDINNVVDMYTIYDYQRDARKKMKEIQAKGKTPIFVGGSGLYIKSALYDLEFSKEEKTTDYSSLTNEELYKRVLEYGNTSIHINNRKRLERLLNKYENHSFMGNHGNEKVYDFICIGLTTDRKNLYNIINNRVDQMMEDGLLKEAKNLYDKNEAVRKSKAINTCIGYKELFSYFDGDISLNDAIELIKKNSRRYAKRQYTYFNHQIDTIKWFTVDYHHFSNTVKEVEDYIDIQTKNC